MPKKNAKKRAAVRACLVQSAVVGYLALPSRAQYYYQHAGGGDWNSTSDSYSAWFDQDTDSSVSVPPGGSDSEVYIETGSNGVSDVNVTFNQTYSTALAYFEIASGNTLTQSGSGTAMIATEESIAGEEAEGTGTYDQSAGSNKVSTELTVGSEDGAGNYTLSGSGSVTTSVLEISGVYNGECSFNQSGGSVQVTSSLAIGDGEGDSDTGLSLYTQTGGTDAITGSLIIGDETNGFYSLGGTASLNVTGSETIGEYASGVFQQTGGTHTISGTLNIGNEDGAGTYNLNGGTLTTGYEQIGSGGIAQFTQTGRAQTISNNLLISGGNLEDNSVPAMMSIDGGATQVNGNAYVGGNASSSGNAGYLFVAGGSLAVTGTLDIYADGASNILSLSSGALTAGFINVNSTPGNFSFTGGTLTLTNQQVDFSSGTDPTYNSILFGNTLALNSGMTLVDTSSSTTGVEYLYGDASLITQNTGSSNSAFALYLGNVSGNGAAAQYALAGGSLSVTEALDGYIGTYTGGNGAGAINQSAGSATYGFIEIGYNAPGSYNQSGGTLVSIFGEYVGAYLGTGSLTVSGNATSNITSTLIVGTSGSININGGSLTSYVTTNNGPILQNGGTSQLGVLGGIGTITVGGDGMPASMSVTQFTQDKITVGSQGLFSVEPNSSFDNSVLTLNLQGGQFDLSNNHMFIDYGSASDPIATIVGFIKSGFNGGNWNGPGIISSTAQIPTNGFRYGIGWADGNDGTHAVAGLSSGQIELKYTLLGDANLDGIVNGSDFSILAANFGKGVTNWDQGNFLYTSSVNGSDFAALAANFGQGDSGADTAVSQADIAALDAFAIANGLPLPAIGAVPEPAAGSSLLLLSVVGTLHRRRRTIPAPLLPSPGTPGED